MELTRDPKPGFGENPGLDGLATAWEATKSIRQHVLQAGGLLKWADAKTHGVINFPNLKKNRAVLEHLLLEWCPNAPDRRTAPIIYIKPQAGRARGIQFNHYANIFFQINSFMVFNDFLARSENSVDL